MIVDVIIPTYKPDEKLLTIISKLRAQTLAPNRIVLVNTEQKYLDNLLRGRRYDTAGKYFEVINISAREFDHGGTRNEGAKGSTAPRYTQDSFRTRKQRSANDFRGCITIRMYHR